MTVGSFSFNCLRVHHNSLLNCTVYMLWCRLLKALVPVGSDLGSPSPAAFHRLCNSSPLQREETETVELENAYVSLGSKTSVRKGRESPMSSSVGYVGPKHRTALLLLLLFFVDDDY